MDIPRDGQGAVGEGIVGGLAVCQRVGSIHHNAIDGARAADIHRTLSLTEEAHSAGDERPCAVPLVAEVRGLQFDAVSVGDKAVGVHLALNRLGRGAVQQNSQIGQPAVQRDKRERLVQLHVEAVQHSGIQQDVERIVSGAEAAQGDGGFTTGKRVQRQVSVQREGGKAVPHAGQADILRLHRTARRRDSGQREVAVHRKGARAVKGLDGRAAAELERATCIQRYRSCAKVNGRPVRRGIQGTVLNGQAPGHREAALGSVRHREGVAAVLHRERGGTHLPVNRHRLGGGPHKVGIVPRPEGERGRAAVHLGPAGVGTPCRRRVVPIEGSAQGGNRQQSVFVGGNSALIEAVNHAADGVGGEGAVRSGHRADEEAVAHVPRGTLLELEGGFPAQDQRTFVAVGTADDAAEVECRADRERALTPHLNGAEGADGAVQRQRGVGFHGDRTGEGVCVFEHNLTTADGLDAAGISHAVGNGEALPVHRRETDKGGCLDTHGAVRHCHRFAAIVRIRFLGIVDPRGQGGAILQDSYQVRCAIRIVFRLIAQGQRAALVDINRDVVVAGRFGKAQPLGHRKGAVHIDGGRAFVEAEAGVGKQHRTAFNVDVVVGALPVTQIEGTHNTAIITARGTLVGTEDFHGGPVLNIQGGSGAIAAS